MPYERPTRTHNVDAPKHSAVRHTTLFSKAQGQTVEMGIANASAIYSMLSDLSAKPGAYVLREAYSNAYDATLRAQSKEPIEIELPTREMVAGVAAKLLDENRALGNLRVTDHGCGMTTEEVSGYFLQYGGSDKTDEVDSVGSKGLGAKAPLAIADAFDVITTKDGVTTHAHITRRPQGAGTARITTETTTKANATTVVVPITSAAILAQMWEFIENLRKFACDINICVNGETIRGKLPGTIGAASEDYACLGTILVNTEPPSRMRAWQRYDTKYGYGDFPHVTGMHRNTVSIAVLVGGVLYPLDGREVAEPFFIVEVDPGWLDFTPSRDEVKMGETTTKLKNALLDALENVNISALIEAHVAAADDRTLCAFRAVSEVGDYETSWCSSAQSQFSRVAATFQFFRSQTGECTVRFRNMHYPISAKTYETLENTTAGCNLDVMTFKMIGASSANGTTPATDRTGLVMNGRECRKDEARSMSSKLSPRALCQVLSNKKDPVCVVYDCHEQADVNWLARNESILRQERVIVWNGSQTTILCGPAIPAPNSPAGRLVNVAKAISLADCKAAVKQANARRRAKLKAQAESVCASGTINAEWAFSTVTSIDIRRDMTQQEALLAIIAPTDDMPKPKRQTLAQLVEGGDASHLAIVMLDEDYSDRAKLSIAVTLAPTLSIALMANPDLIGDNVTTLVAMDAKSVKARAFTDLMNCGPTLIADRRTKVRSVRHDGICDLHPDILTIDEQGRITINVSGIDDYEALARMFAFSENMRMENSPWIYDWPSRLVIAGIDETMLDDKPRHAIEDTRSLYAQYRVDTVRNNYGEQTVIIPFTLAGHDVQDSNRVYYGHVRQIIAKDVPERTREILDNAKAIQDWSDDLLGDFNLPSHYSKGSRIDNQMLARIAIFSSALANDMNAYFDKKGN